MRRGRLPRARCCNSLESTRRPPPTPGPKATRHSSQAPRVCPLSLCLPQGHRIPCEVEEVFQGPKSSPLCLKKEKLRPREGWRVSGGQKRLSLGSKSAVFFSLCPKKLRLGRGEHPAGCRAAVPAPGWLSAESWTGPSRSPAGPGPGVGWQDPPRWAGGK